MHFTFRSKIEENCLVKPHHAVVKMVCFDRALYFYQFAFESSVNTEVNYALSLANTHYFDDWSPLNSPMW